MTLADFLTVLVRTRPMIADFLGLVVKLGGLSALGDCLVTVEMDDLDEGQCGSRLLVSHVTVPGRYKLFVFFRLLGRKSSADGRISYLIAIYSCLEVLIFNFEAGI